MKVVINSCFGGFGLSLKAVELYAQKSGFKVFHYVQDFKDDKISRYAEDDKAFCIHHLKNDIGDEPTNKELNDAEWFHERDIERNDPILIEVVEELGKEVNTKYSELKIIEIPDGTDYVVEEYDGNEHIAEVHTTWY